jgi:hypothetical protein
MTISSAVGLYWAAAAAWEVLCVAAVAVAPTAREADLWTMVRVVVLVRDGEGTTARAAEARFAGETAAPLSAWCRLVPGEATPRAIIWRFAGGGWP